MTTSASQQPPVAKSDEEWRAQLSPEEYAVLRQAGTERALTGEYTDTKTVGVYECRACGAELFRSETKFDSHCGWPSFFAPLAEDTRRSYIEDRTLGMKRTEVRCGNCGSATSGTSSRARATSTPTGPRYCINSISMTLSLEPAPRSSSRGFRARLDGARQRAGDSVGLAAAPV